MGRLTTAPGPLSTAKAGTLPSTARRGSARERGYTAQWDRASKLFLARNPLCVGGLARGRTVAAVLTDHIQPHKGDRRLFWDETNWQASCGWCHNVLKQRLEAMFERGEICADDLRLDSPVALDLAARLLAGG